MLYYLDIGVRFILEGKLDQIRGVLDDQNTTLAADDDAATANLGSPWRMPTFDEFMELRDNCTLTWTTQDGVNGCQVDGPNGNAIFLPAAGYCDASGLRREGDVGDYWSSSLNAVRSSGALEFFFNSDRHEWPFSPRCFRFTVRPVRP